MDGQIFVLIIIFGSFLFAGLMHWMKVKGDAMKARNQSLSDDAKAELAELRQRVQVLERIITDKRERLKEEIDAL
ncbi:MAG: hypothetical protein HWE25_07115 [Alphaproteobacteria bacterium]|nr:hypothetical protein [Alphaproteobacteria bacterium]